MLKAVVKVDLILPTLDLDPKKITTSIFAFCGRPDMVLQMHQLLSNTARFYCKEEAGFKGLLQKHVNDWNTSDRTLQFYSELN